MSDSDHTAQPDPRDIRPIVPLGSSNDWGLWIFLGVLLIGGITLFSVMSTNREAAEAPATFAEPSLGANRIASPPPIGLPRRFLEPAQEEQPETGVPPRPGNPPVQYTPIPLAPPAQPTSLPPPYEARSEVSPERPRIVFESREPATSQPVQASESADSERARASRFANPSRTVPRGTVIPAVLETAVDSTRPGAVRALVQRDIHAFDGSRVLIPRGTRLYGEYEADLERGQNRANITWTRLLRPDGVTMNLNSPASDPLGRAGVKGKVDGKFLQRFGGAILQSVLDIGVGVAVREASDGVIVALPGSTQNVTQSVAPGDVRPTLQVKHGTSVSIFVARDLDFSSVEP